MTPRDAFVHDICREPHRDDVRMIFADWLQDNGEPERAEFIRAGIKMARYTDCPTMLRDRVHRRPNPYRCGICDYCVSRKLCEKLAAILPLQTPWSGGFAYCLTPQLDMPRDWSSGWLLSIERGFVWGVQCQCEAWLEYGPQLIVRHPVTHVGVIDKRPGGADEDGFSRVWLSSCRNVISHAYDIIPRPLEPWFLEAVRLGRQNDGFYDETFEGVAYRDPGVFSEDFSRACVDWARREAGLPPLEVSQ